MPVGIALTGPALWLNPVLGDAGASAITALALCLSIYLLLEAAATHDVLGRLRHELLKEEATSCAMVTRKSVQLA